MFTKWNRDNKCMKQSQITYMYKYCLQMNIGAFILAQQTQIQNSWNSIHYTNVANASLATFA